MVIITIPKEVSDMMDDIKSHLNREVIKVALKYGVPWELIRESKTIDDSIKDITETISRFNQMLKTHGTNTSMFSMDEVYFKPIKKCKINKELFETIKRMKKMDKMMKEIKTEKKTKKRGRPRKKKK